MRNLRAARPVTLTANETRAQWLAVSILAGAFALLVWCTLVL
jgi:hypothetical protein